MFKWFKIVSKRFTAQEITIIIKIMIKQDIFSIHWKEKLEKFHIDNKVKTMCECKNDQDGLIHRIKHCNISKRYAKRIKWILKNDWDNVQHPMDLFMNINSQKDMERIINSILLFLKKIGKIKILLSHKTK